MTDLISRQDAIALLETMYRASPWNVGLAEAVDAVTNMPSADTLATNEINALKDALAQAEGVIGQLQCQVELWQDAGRY